jgi:hypothetical protein
MDALQLLSNQGQSGTAVSNLGISEWMCYYANYDRPGGQVENIDTCIDLHQAAGFDQIVWNAGRSVVDYWSELPNVTRMCEVSDQVGGTPWAFVRSVMQEACPLRRALAYCHDRAIPVWGRLGMNRHYGSAGSAGVTSRMSLENPTLRERSKLGREVPHRLCYALQEVRQERIDILLEIQRIGVDGLLLDFCRQMPALMYHDALVEPYRERSGIDPRQIDSDDPEDYRDWFQYRSDVLTGFMGDLRKAVQIQENTLGRPCPILARVPDSAPWLMRAYGLDIERWFAGDLIEGTMLSPFPLSVADRASHPEYHIETAHRHDKLCIGGIGSKNLIRNGSHENTGFYHPRPIYERADRQYRAGVDAISLYQTETLARMPYLKEMLLEISDRETVTRRLGDLPRVEIPEEDSIGVDWHSKFDNGHGLRVSVSGDTAL